MATKKKAASAAKSDKDGSKPVERQSEATRQALEEAYNKLIGGFAGALEAFNRGELAEAKAGFEEVIGSADDEVVLRDRARSYAQICERRMTPAPDEPATAEERYYKAVLLLNDGRADEALLLIDQALQEMPSSAKYLYARASAWALQGNVEAAVSDLRQAISVDPQIRFQATNDPDFERIREEPAFIDIIEPTPSGA
jgi:tetratricopeptide (TPR) repeat protein